MTELETLLGFDEELQKARKADKSLKAEDSVERTNARAHIRNYAQTELGTNLPDEVPLNEEVYDNFLISWKASAGARIGGHYHDHKTEIVSELRSSGKLEQKAAEISPVELPEGHSNRDVHNKAAGLHGAYLGISAVNQAYDAGEIKEDKLYAIAAQELVNVIGNRLNKEKPGNKHIEDREIALAQRAVLSALASSEKLVRAVTGGIERGALDAFKKYFEGKPYSLVDYADTNLRSNPDEGRAAEEAARIAR